MRARSRETASGARTFRRTEAQRRNRLTLDSERQSASFASITHVSRVPSELGEGTAALTPEAGAVGVSNLACRKGAAQIRESSARSKRTSNCRKASLGVASRISRASLEVLQTAVPPQQLRGRSLPSANSARGKASPAEAPLKRVPLQEGSVWVLQFERPFARRRLAAARPSRASVQSAAGQAKSIPVRTDSTLLRYYSQKARRPSTPRPALASDYQVPSLSLLLYRRRERHTPFYLRDGDGVGEAVNEFCASLVRQGEGGVTARKENHRGLRFEPRRQVGGLRGGGGERQTCVSKV